MGWASRQVCRFYARGQKGPKWFFEAENGNRERLVQACAEASAEWEKAEEGPSDSEAGVCFSFEQFQIRALVRWRPWKWGRRGETSN